MGPLPFPVQGIQPWHSFPVLCIGEEPCKTGAALPEEAIGMALHSSCSFCRHPEIQPVSSVDWSCFCCWQPEIPGCGGGSFLLGRVWDKGYGGQLDGGFQGLIEACG